MTAHLTLKPHHVLCKDADATETGNAHLARLLPRRADLGDRPYAADDTNAIRLVH